MNTMPVNRSVPSGTRLILTSIFFLVATTSFSRDLYAQDQSEEDRLFGLPCVIFCPDGDGIFGGLFQGDGLLGLGLFGDDGIFSGGLFGDGGLFGGGDDSNEESDQTDTGGDDSSVEEPSDDNGGLFGGLFGDIGNGGLFSDFELPNIFDAINFEIPELFPNLDLSGLLDDPNLGQTLIDLGAPQIVGDLFDLVANAQGDMVSTLSSLDGTVAQYRCKRPGSRKVLAQMLVVRIKNMMGQAQLQELQQRRVNRAVRRTTRLTNLRKGRCKNRARRLRGNTRRSIKKASRSITRGGL